MLAVLQLFLSDYWCIQTDLRYVGDRTQWTIKSVDTGFMTNFNAAVTVSTNSRVIKRQFRAKQT